MIRLLNVSKVIDNSTNPPIEIISNPTFTEILPQSRTINYYRVARQMCNCCMQYPRCFNRFGDNRSCNCCCCNSIMNNLRVGLFLLGSCCGCRCRCCNRNNFTMY